ncbi:MAG: cell division protein ZapA [Bacteroidales bacterium]|nr:cell division protein ZapA [Bacteroidales bacterium]
MNDKFTIRIKIAESSHPLTINRDQEELYRKAAKLVNQRLADYKEKYKNIDLDDNHFLSFVALEFAVKYLKVDENKGIDSLGEKIEEITRDVEEFLKNK